MMNELDNFKNAWKTISEAESKRDYSTDDLKKIVRKKSGSELAKIHRKLIIEWGIAIVLSGLMVLFIHSIQPADTPYALLFIGVILAAGFFPYMNIIRMKLSNHNDLKNHLQEFILKFDTLVKQYIRMAAILIPVAGLGGFLLGLHSNSGSEEWNLFFSTGNIILGLLFLVIISFSGYWVQCRYFKWVYGKNIQRLRDCLADLEEVEEKNDK